ncbi:MAG: endonuclease III [Clostridia bacterium]|nr:endonuclease III [Clostridia bacterium]
MLKKERALAAVELLKQKYPDAKCSLNYETPFQLLIATRLSAQCTDARVNMVTPALFKKYPTAEKLGNANLAEVENIIKSCGLYKTKAKDIISIGQDIANKFSGIVPSTLEELTALSGVGRKTANLICGDIYGKPAVVTDTHFIRITGRLGLTNSKNPLIVEKDLIKLLPKNESSDFCHRIVLHGRETCTARAPKCENCVLSGICLKKGVKK